ncbi:periplasmic divalent cation tolerance protein [Roseimicrobium gellanilyticum]|uniref:Periplasmic divalent cation tolerance protein n=1 Tax=Roseimicrobium gellanilyticum TaxID=748857 RepID=A0A366HBW1_9BACT|nr:divalent-cation tolerance protein CutA [Roseimicrobium gellanilyticum]RBP39851.1 periplasmic divalent cation tolerance protein [Roseimicrobium gellanilyticum]
MEDIVVVFCTFPDSETAKRIAQELVKGRLAACVNVLPGVESIYEWKGELESASEVLGLIKTTGTMYPTLEARLKELHPYDVPEIVAIPASKVQPAYAQWVREMTSQE